MLRAINFMQYLISLLSAQLRQRGLCWAGNQTINGRMPQATTPLNSRMKARSGLLTLVSPQTLLLAAVERAVKMRIMCEG